MKYREHSQITLDGFASVRLVIQFLIHTLDGLLATALAVGYTGLGICLYFGLVQLVSEVSWEILLGIFFMPLLLLSVFLRHRIGTTISETKPVIFNVVSLLVTASVPIYLIFRN